ncbi:MAG: hypothetical protein ACRDFQ_01595, partial [Anaerolineales bacterium]
IDVYPMRRAEFNRKVPLAHRYRGGMEAWEVRDTRRQKLANRWLHTSAEPAPGASTSTIIGSHVHGMWIKTHCHLIDQDHGHASSRHPSLGNDASARKEAVENLTRAANKGFQPGDLIFVEWDRTSNKVVSYGHHYYYRWRFVDTVRTRRSGAGVWEPRPEVAPAAFEKERDSSGSPFALTGVRALFGYASGDDGNEGCQSIGEGDFTQLAGRIAINTAVETTERPADDRREGGEPPRFLSQSSGFAVPFHELASPKPSASEFYLNQAQLPNRSRIDGGIVVTYGDLPNRDPRGDLGGRKFYRHNPKAAEEPRHYTADGDQDLLNDRAAIGRFVSAPTTRFQFKVRFRDLSKEELGVFLLALCPDQFVKLLPENSRGAVQAKTDGDSNRPRYAAKLGHGRPLGLGSIVVNVDKALQVVERNGGFGFQPLEEDVLETYLVEADRILNRNALKEWLAIQDFRETQWRTYPTRNDTIYNWHTHVRQRHSRGRRQKP